MSPAAVDLGLALGRQASDFDWSPAHNSELLGFVDAGCAFDVDEGAFGKRRPLLFLERLREGADGLNQTVARMQGFVEACVLDPRLICRRAVEQIVQHTPGGDRLAESSAVWAWVKRHVRYTRDPAFLEYLQDPRALLWLIDKRWLAFGDCDDHAMLTAALLWSIRVPCVFVLVATERDADFAHVYAAAELGSTSAEERARWLQGDDSARSGLLCLDTASPDAAFGRHPHGAWRRVVPSIS